MKHTPSLLPHLQPHLTRNRKCLHLTASLLRTSLSHLTFNPSTSPPRQPHLPSLPLKTSGSHREYGNAPLPCLFALSLALHASIPPLSLPCLDNTAGIWNTSSLLLSLSLPHLPSLRASLLTPSCSPRPTHITLRYEILVIIPSLSPLTLPLASS